MSSVLSSDAGFDAQHLQVVAFAKQEAILQYAQPLQAFPRVLHECPVDCSNTTVNWKAQGRKVSDGDKHGTTQIWLDLHIDTNLTVQCQRCLQNMELPLKIERSFRFVNDEATAAQLDEEIEEDVLVCSQHFDLLALIEDELLMAMPISPRHNICQSSSSAHASSKVLAPTNDGKENPFAILQSLKKKNN